MEAKMTVAADWQAHNILTRPDGSYVITLGGYPYHVPPQTEGFAELWGEVDVYARAHPEQIEPEPGPPAPTIDDARVARLAEISAGYDAALTATLTMPSSLSTGIPSAAQVSTEAALFAATDPEGLADVMAVLAVRRAELEAAVNAAQTAAEIMNIVVNYPV